MFTSVVIICLSAIIRVASKFIWRGKLLVVPMNRALTFPSHVALQGTPNQGGSIIMGYNDYSGTLLQS